MPQFSTSEVTLKKGDEIFVIDLSGLIVKALYNEMTGRHIQNSEVYHIARACEEHIKEQQESGVPLVVDSGPVFIQENRYFDDEYYVKVHLKNEPRLSYYILNPSVTERTRWIWKGGVKHLESIKAFSGLTFRDHSDYMEELMDIEMCRACGY